MKTILFALFPAWFAWLLVAPVQAAEFCVTSSAGLQAALTTAAGNGEHNTIRIAAGIYDVPTGGFSYNGAQENRNLTISGGWGEAFGYACGQILAETPDQTFLVGNNAHRVLNVTLGSTGHFTIRRVAFVGGSAAAGSAFGGGGLRVQRITGYAGVATIERNAFYSNRADHGGGLEAALVFSGSGRLRVVNNVFWLNHGRVGSGAARLLVMDGDSGLFGAGVYITNNTALENTTDDGDSGRTGGFFIDGHVPTIYVTNNNLWGNQGHDLRVLSGLPGYTLNNNNIGSRAGDDPDFQAGNISIQPQYMPCPPVCPPWVPARNSPLVDGGRHPPTLFPQWYLTELDLRGELRVNGSRVDIGAYENHDGLFFDRFEQ